MSNTRYIEISSNYRDRNLYPSPADFIVDIAQSGTPNAINARDPVSNAAVQKNWNGSFDNSTNSATVTITGVSTGTNPTDSIVLIITAASGDLRQEDKFYVGSVIDVTYNTSQHALRRIEDYKFVDVGDRGQIRVNYAFPDGIFSPGLTGFTSAVISNPGNASDTARPTVFIPASPPIPNYYTNLILTNVTRDESVTITDFSDVTHLAVLSSTQASWSATEEYLIRGEYPCSTGAIAAATTRYVQLSTASSNVQGQYVGGFLRIASPLQVAPYSTTVAPYGEEKRIVQYNALDTLFIGTAPGVTNAFTLGSGASNVDNIYNGSYITTSIATYRIQTYTGSTRSGTITGVFGGEAVGDTAQIRTAVLQDAFSAVPSTVRYEVECFTRDNYAPMTYTGSTVSQNEMVCYEVELVNLVLPNTELNVGRGGRIAFYPYIYVEFSNVSASGAGTRGMIYSNNPNANSMLFKCTIDDIATPLLTPFIKIDSDGMTQTLKFKPNDNLRFSVRLPDGTVFSTVEQEFVGPQTPNPLIQISALFAIKRV